ncbi:MAG: hypothetical protein R3B90_03430 [Planctomycetaceae bacterium]
MSAPPQDQRRIVVVEPQPRWLPELRRQFRGRDIGVEPLEAAVRLVVPNAEQPSLFVCDAAAMLADLWRSFTILRPETTPVIVLLADSQRHWEWPLRELGVASVLSVRCTGHELARTCERWLRGTGIARQIRGLSTDG